MKPRILLACILLGITGCSDSGLGPGVGWKEYVLPYTRVSLPSELVQRQSAATLPENPDFAGVVDNQRLTVQLCIYTVPMQSQFMDVEEQTITLHGRRAVLFQGLGLFHPYDSHFRNIVGMKAYFRPDGEPAIIIIAVESAEGATLARRILFTMRPDPTIGGELL